MAFASAEIAPRLSGIEPKSSVSPIFEIPFHLRKKTLLAIRFEEGKDIEKLWTERGQKVEERVKSILERESDIIKEVTMNPLNTPLSDLTVWFVEDFPITQVRIEVKSSWMGVRDYKDKIIPNLEKNDRNDEGVKRWMTNQKIILINGSESKKPDTILKESFYPHLQRIIYSEEEKKSADTETTIFAAA